MPRKVAVLLSVYGRDDFKALKQAVESVLNQTYSNFILYIYRDGVIDGSVQVYLDRLVSEDDRVVLLVGDFNQGLAYALNQLIDRALQDGADYLARMDSDDISLSDRLASQVDFLEARREVDVLGAFCSEFDSEFSLPVKTVPLEHKELVDFSVARCPMIHPTVMFRARVFESGLRYPTESALSEDIALWHKLILEGYIFHNLDKVLLRYRLNNATLSRRTGLPKAMAELRLRLSFMIDSRNVSVNNIGLIVVKFFFHISPRWFVAFAYRHLR